MPIHTYTNWNVRPSDAEEQIEPFRKYFFICEGANTETFYFRKLIDLRKTLNIHPLIDIRLMEKTEEHSNLSYPKQLLEFAETLKDDESLDFDKEHDKMIVIFDADIFEEKVSGYEDLIKEGEKRNTIGITNPGFEVIYMIAGYLAQKTAGFSLPKTAGFIIPFTPSESWFFFIVKMLLLVF